LKEKRQFYIPPCIQLARSLVESLRSVAQNFNTNCPSLWAVGKGGGNRRKVQLLA